MDVQLIKLLLEAGISVIAFVGLAYLFILTMRAHRSERKEWHETSIKEREEWRESSEEQTQKVSDAIKELAHSINNRSD